MGEKTISHDVAFCARYADLVSRFFDGRMLTTDHPRRFFGNNSFYTTAANQHEPSCLRPGSDGGRCD